MKYNLLLTNILLCLAILFLQSCWSHTTIDTTESKFVVIGKNFTSESINKKVYFSNTFTKNDLNKPDLKNHIMRSFKRNDKNDIVFLGESYNNEYRWIYFEIISQSLVAKKLAIDATHLRCDGLEGFILKNTQLVPLGKIKRDTPLDERAYPYFDFALSLTIQPTDTLGILIQSERHSGIHELDLTVSENKSYIKKAQFENFKGNFSIAYCSTFMIVMLFLGMLFKQKVLIYYAIYLVAMTNVYVHTNYYFDAFPFPQQTGLQAHSIGAFTIFLANALLHPFVYYLIKHIPVNHRRYITLAKIIAGINISMMLLILLPTSRLSSSIYSNALTILITVNMIWCLYYAWQAYYRAKMIYYLVVCVIAFVPTLIQLLFNIFHLGGGELKLSTSYFNTLHIIFIVAYLAIEQFRRELISKQQQDKNLSELKVTMEEIRKGEIANIGRNLHDQVGNTLASALGYLDMKIPKTSIVKNLIFEAINEIRFLSHNLVKDDNQPITYKIEALISRFNDFSSIYFQYNDFTNGNINKLESLKQQNIYMIIQEILTNIIKHSKAREAFIQIFENDGSAFHFNIEDDGIGIDNYHISDGIGLKNINKRADLANLKLTIDSTSEGTNIIIEVRNENESNNHR